jgi:AcrR family transcriptional regulator
MSRAGAADTRNRLIEAGIDLLCRLTPTDLVSAVGTREIARMADVSAASFFHHFGSVERYTDELMDAIYSPTRLPRGDRVRVALETVAADDLPVSVLLTMYRNALNLNLDDSEYRLKLGLWALGGPSADARYSAYQNAVEEAIVVGAAHMLRGWGREPRPPFDLRNLVTIGNALTQGAYVRHTLNPEFLSVEHHALAITGTVLLGLRLIGDERTMADRLAEMNYYPQATASADATRSLIDGGTKDRLLAAAAELFAEYGVEATSVAQVAKRAGVSTTTFFNLYGSKSHLALALFDRHSELHMAARRGQFDPSDALVDHLVGVADLAACHPEMAKIFLAELASDDSGTLGIVLVDPLAELLASSSKDGEGPTEGNDRDTAQLMVTVAVHRILHRPSLGAESAARWALRILAHPAPS